MQRLKYNQNIKCVRMYGMNLLNKWILSLSSKATVILEKEIFVAGHVKEVYLIKTLEPSYSHEFID